MLHNNLGKHKEIYHSNDSNNKSQENLQLSKELAKTGDSSSPTAENKKLIEEHVDIKYGNEYKAVKGALTKIIEMKLDDSSAIAELTKNVEEKYRVSIDHEVLIEQIQDKLYKRI